MTTPPFFPALAGQGWSVHKKPTFATIVAPHPSGREVRDALYVDPIWQFEVTFAALTTLIAALPGAGYLTDDAGAITLTDDSTGALLTSDAGFGVGADGVDGLGGDSLQALMGLFLQLGGRLGTFLYVDPSDNAATAQALATGDGSTAAFAFARAIGGFLEPVGWVTSVGAVYLNGVAQASSSWALTPPNTLSFGSPPGASVAISADFAFAFECRIDDDALDFEQFMSNLWKCESFKFRSVRTS